MEDAPEEVVGENGEAVAAGHPLCTYVVGGAIDLRPKAISSKFLRTGSEIWSPQE